MRFLPFDCHIEPSQSIPAGNDPDRNALLLEYRPLLDMSFKKSVQRALAKIGRAGIADCL